MKQTILSILCCLAFATANAQTVKISLQHAGGVTLFDADQMTQAIAAATEGDTLYLNEGNFAGDFTIDKAITIVGAGQASKINGNVTISIPGTKTLTKRVLDALYISGDIKNTLAVNGLGIRKCQFANISFSGNSNDIVIESCRISGDFMLSSYVKGITTINSKIKRVVGSAASANGVNFINCDVYNIYNYYINDNGFGGGTFINSIIGRTDYSSSSYPIYSTTMVCCLLPLDNSVLNSCTLQNCYSSSNAPINSNLTPAYDTDTMISNGWLGNDGTVVGSMGGAAPYTLEPAVPKVESYSINVDTEAKVLSVSLKVKAN